MVKKDFSRRKVKEIAQGEREVIMTRSRIVS
jgi:hypothetical protein